MRHFDDKDPDCPKCKIALARQLPAPKSIWLKNWSEYGLRESDKSFANYTPDGVWAYRTKSPRTLDGSPERVLLKSRQDVVEHCKAEGLMLPDDINPNAEFERDGKTVQTAGTSGQWI